MTKGEFKVGDVVVITVTYDAEEFYQVGAKATLVEKDDDGDWWAQFRDLGNPEDSFDDSLDGVWCIGGNHPTRNKTRFELASN